ncbi:unnamed protein product [Mytilus edulis]|uniref:Uncharacterized protein n=1 Tax=Mytilus edulis TaxID=6550 RepID=A0A8S3SXK0_MYTED|nr:unnamed protein product [Mytilus edulis]
MPSQNSQEPNVDPQLQEMFDYGTKNEINAVATVVSGFLLHFTSSSFMRRAVTSKEIQMKKTVLVVSPDGSIQANEMRASSRGRLHNSLGTIFDAGLVNDVDKDSVEDKVEMRKDADNRLFVGHIRGIRLFKTYRSTAHKIRVLKPNLDTVLPDDSGVNSPASEIDSILNDIPLNVMSSLQESEIASLQSISTNKDDFIHLNIDTYETLDAEVQLPTASVSNETIGVDYTGGTDQAMDEGIVDESHETVESGDGPDLYAQFISATGVTYNDLLDSLLSKDRKTKVTKDNFCSTLNQLVGFLQD